MQLFPFELLDDFHLQLYLCQVGSLGLLKRGPQRVHHWRQNHLKKMLNYAKKGCAEIFEKQKQVLREKYKTGEDSVENE